MWRIFCWTTCSSLLWEKPFGWSRKSKLFSFFVGRNQNYTKVNHALPLSILEEGKQLSLRLWLPQIVSGRRWSSQPCYKWNPSESQIHWDRKDREILWNISTEESKLDFQTWSELVQSWPSWWWKRVDSGDIRESWNWGFSAQYLGQILLDIWDKYNF